MRQFRHRFSSSGITLETVFTYPDAEEDAAIELIFTDSEGNQVTLYEKGHHSGPAAIEALIALGRHLDREWIPRSRKTYKEESRRV